LKKNLPQYNIKTKENLLYKMIIDSEGKLQPKSYKNPKRGQYAFQIDVLIRNKDNMPLVAIETKSGGFSTHDVLTYSTKAVKHKEIYPYLRYGFIVGEKSKIDRKFFIHNLGFDFVIAVKNLEHDLDKLVEIVMKQIEAAEQISKILEKKENQPSLYATNVELKWASNK